MSEGADLLMPKLGLTMTEGTVARWVAAPGQKFAAGDVIVIVETDKIANEIEAPAAGELIAQHSTEGEVVPVGTPIARWQLDAASSRPTKASTQAEVPTPERAYAAEIVARITAADAGRIIATPYARRLAREASLALDNVDGSGPRGRIKAADVLRALQARPATDGAASATTVMQRAAFAAVVHPAGLSFATVDVDVGALRALDVRLARAQNHHFERRAYIALACIKALDSSSTDGVSLGFALNGGIGTLTGAARDTLSTIAARLAHLEAADGSGDVAIFIVDGRARLLVPAVPQGWRMALGVGGVREVRGGDATHQMTLALAYDGAIVDHDFAAQLLDRMAALLEEPLHLLGV